MIQFVNINNSCSNNNYVNNNYNGNNKLRNDKIYFQDHFYTSLFWPNKFFVATLIFGPYLRGRLHLPPVNHWILFWYWLEVTRRLVMRFFTQWQWNVCYCFNQKTLHSCIITNFHTSFRYYLMFYVLLEKKIKKWLHFGNAYCSIILMKQSKSCSEQIHFYH